MIDLRCLAGRERLALGSIGPGGLEELRSLEPRTLDAWRGQRTSRRLGAKMAFVQLGRLGFVLRGFCFREVAVVCCRAVSSARGPELC